MATKKPKNTQPAPVKKSVTKDPEDESSLKQIETKIKEISQLLEKLPEGFESGLPGVDEFMIPQNTWLHVIKQNVIGEAQELYNQGRPSLGTGFITDRK